MGQRRDTLLKVTKYLLNEGNQLYVLVHAIAFYNSNIFCVSREHFSSQKRETLKASTRIRILCTEGN
jgi:hypothetical protein